MCLNNDDILEQITPADKSGLPPGSLMHIGSVLEDQPSISITQYNAESLTQQVLNDVEQLETLTLNTNEYITWININGLSDTQIIKSIGQLFAIHPLVLEDILSTHQRPKLEEHDDYLYLVLKVIANEEDSLTDELAQQSFALNYQQISMLLFENCVITFKEQSDKLFDPIDKRLKNKKGRLRRGTSDYLSYVIVDTVVDGYFIIDDLLDEIIEPLEDSLLDKPLDNALPMIQALRRELMTMKRNINPLRELLTKIKHSDSNLLQDENLRFFNDIHDHVLRVIDALEIYRERIAAMQDIYLTSISHKMNETMKILTIFSTIFIPLTFIAGIYGMNFEYMPELKWRWGYPMLWLVFLGISTLSLSFFKKKKWL